MAQSPLPIAPGSTLGMLGGGQLGRMWCQAAHTMGYRTMVLDADADSPAGRIAYDHVQAGYDDAQALAHLAQHCAAISTEFENVPATALQSLAAKTRVTPSAAAVAVAQDRLQEKTQLQAAGVAVGPYAALTDSASLHAAQADSALFPAIVKTARLGYDGKGQQRVMHAQDLAPAWQNLGQVPCIVEQLLPLAYEISVIVARDDAGHCVHLPVQRNTHVNGILAVTEVAPAAEQLIPSAMAQKAIAYAQQIATQLDYVGVLCVEFFVLQNGQLLANEMAPRPHNSGHYSIEACDLSQFDLQLRCMTGQPLVPVRLHSAAIMLNLLGELWLTAPSASPREPYWHSVLQAQHGCGIHVHLYGKTLAKPGRKMGHITITAPHFQQAKAEQLRIAALLGLPC